MTETASAIRIAAMNHCASLAATWGDAVPASELTAGFSFAGKRILLVSWGRGIFKPKELLDGPLTLVSSLGSHYEDEALEGSVMLYDYAPPAFAWANDGLKRLSESGQPVILLKQVKAKPNPEYMLFAPVAVVGFDDRAHKFRLNLAPAKQEYALPGPPTPSVFSKRYAETIAKARLHQAYFRRDTLTAYRSRCCVCDLRERPLLDAAHIVDDRLPEGVASVTNGMAMCPTHHRAFDRNLLLITADYKIKVQRDRLEDLAATATKRVLLDFDGQAIALPRDQRYRPNPDLLAMKMTLACG
jgi:putative restriction endonuclease